MEDNTMTVRLFNKVGEKPVRPITNVWLELFGSSVLIFIALTFVAASIGNFDAILFSLLACVVLLWLGIAFLWHSVRQQNEKIKALVTLLENRYAHDSSMDKKLASTYNRIESLDRHLSDRKNTQDKANS